MAQYTIPLSRFASAKVRFFAHSRNTYGHETSFSGNGLGMDFRYIAFPREQSCET